MIDENVKFIIYIFKFDWSNLEFNYVETMDLCHLIRIFNAIQWSKQISQSRSSIFKLNVYCTFIVHSCSANSSTQTVSKKPNVQVLNPSPLTQWHSHILNWTLFFFVKKKLYANKVGDKHKCIEKTQFHSIIVFISLNLFIIARIWICPHSFRL